MADIFGYDKPAKSSGQVASADFALVSVSAKNALVQSVDASYTQKVEEIAQVGDTQIYWLPGRPQGALKIDKLVGSGGFFAGWDIGACGVIASSTVNLGGGAGNSKCSFQGQGTLTFTGAVVENINVRLGTQQQTITESLSLKVASISKA